MLLADHSLRVVDTPCAHINLRPLLNKTKMWNECFPCVHWYCFRVQYRYRPRSNQPSRLFWLWLWLWLWNCYDRFFLITPKMCKNLEMTINSTIYGLCKWIRLYGRYIQMIPNFGKKDKIVILFLEFKWALRLVRYSIYIYINTVLPHTFFEKLKNF